MNSTTIVIVMEITLLGLVVILFVLLFLVFPFFVDGYPVYHRKGSTRKKCVGCGKQIPQYTAFCPHCDRTQ